MGRGHRRPSIKMNEKGVRGDACTNPDKLRRGMGQAKPEPEKEMKPKEEPDIRDGIPDRKTLDANALVEKIMDLDYDRVRYMLETAKINPNYADENGMFPLIAAIRLKKRKMINLMLNHHAEINITDKTSGRSPLMEAVISRDAKSVKLLVSLGADNTARDFEGKTAEDYCMLLTSRGEVEIGSKMRELVRITEAATLKNIKRRLNEAAAEEKEEEELRLKKFYSRRIVDCVLEGEYEQLKHYLQFEHCDPNVPDEKGRYALIEAAKKQDRALIDLLIENGASRKVKDSDGKTAKYHIKQMYAR